MARALWRQGVTLRVAELQIMATSQFPAVTVKQGTTSQLAPRAPRATLGGMV